MPTIGAALFSVDCVGRENSALHDDDPLRDWIDRGSICMGLGRHPACTLCLDCRNPSEGRRE